MKSTFREFTGGFAIETSQDCGPIVEANKRAFNAASSRSGDLKQIASVPLVIIEKWKNELGVDMMNPNHKDAVRRLLNDPEWRFLRTSPGRV